MEVLSIPRQTRNFDRMLSPHMAQDIECLVQIRCDSESVNLLQIFALFYADLPPIKVLLRPNVQDMVASEKNTLIDSLFVLPALSLVQRFQPDFAQSNCGSPSKALLRQANFAEHKTTVTKPSWYG